MKTRRWIGVRLCVLQSLWWCVTATSVNAQDRLGPATALEPRDDVRLSPFFINDDGVIVGQRYDVPLVENCDVVCNRIRKAVATSGFLKEQDAPPIRLSGDTPVALSERVVITQDRFSQGAPLNAAVVTDLASRTQSTLPLLLLGKDCTVRDVDGRGRLLCLLNEGGPAVRAYHLYLFDPHERTFAPLPCWNDSGNCVAVAMNEAGLIVGNDFTHGPMIWTTPGKMERLAIDPRFSRITVVDVNEGGTILGRADDAERRSWVVWWRASDRQLHVFGEGRGAAINDADVVAGQKDAPPVPSLNEPTSGGAERVLESKAYLFDLRRGLEVELPGVTGSERSTRAVDINNEGVAIGLADGRGVVFDAYRRPIGDEGVPSSTSASPPPHTPVVDAPVASEPASPPFAWQAELEGTGCPSGTWKVEQGERAEQLLFYLPEFAARIAPGIVSARAACKVKLILSSSEPLSFAIRSLGAAVATMLEARVRAVINLIGGIDGSSSAGIRMASYSLVGPMYGPRLPFSISAGSPTDPVKWSACDTTHVLTVEFDMTVNDPSDPARPQSESSYMRLRSDFTGDTEALRVLLAARRCDSP